MTAIAYDECSRVSEDDEDIISSRPCRREAEDAVRTLIAWAGDDPNREGLLDTPERVVRAFEEWFSGYGQDPEAILARTFEEVENYDDIVLLRDIRLESTCEHHMAPIIGKIHIAYLPDGKVVGLSKLARLVDAFAKRLQIQEKLTAQIAATLDDVLTPRGVAVVIEAEHHCMSTRGVHRHGVDTITTRFTGVFDKDPVMQQRFLSLIKR